jgi:hypothetical protein
MKIAIISLLLSSMFLLPTRGFAQQSSDDPVATQAHAITHPQQTLHLTKPARRTAAFQSALSAVKVFCSKNKDNAACKSDSTEYNAASKLVEKSPELQAYIETGVLPDKPIKFGSLPAPDKSDADTSDKSWMGAGLAQMYSTSSGTSVPQKVTMSDSLGDVETQMTILAGKTSRELGNEYARDIQFPGRDRWEQDLYAATGKFIAATRGWIAVMRSSNPSKGALNDAVLNMKLAQIECSDLQAHGLAEAAKWESNR